MKILFDDIQRKKVILLIGENKYPIDIKFDLSAALALENKCGSLENISKILNLETSLWIFQFMINAGIAKYNKDNDVKLPKIEHIENCISTESLADAVTVRSIILKIVFDDLASEEDEKPQNDKKKESETPETT